MKKINIGIILIVLFILGIVFYLIYEQDVHKKDVESIRIFLDNYYKVFDKYSMLYEEDRDIDKIIDVSKYDKYKEDMRYELDKYIVQDDFHKNNILDIYNSRIDEQIKGKSMNLKHEKIIHDFNSVFFDGDYIFVIYQVESNVDKVMRLGEIINKDTNKYEGNTIRFSLLEHVYDKVVLKKEKGEYKIVLHNAYEPGNRTEDSGVAILW